MSSDKPRSLRIALLVGAVLLLQGGAVLVYRAIEARRGPAPALADFDAEPLSPRPAPPLTLTRAGETVRFEPVPGQAALVHFWATWCVPCREELPALLEATRALPARERPRVIAVSVDTNWNSIRLFFDGEVPPEILQDATGQAPSLYGVSALPDTFLVGPDGTLRYRATGARDWRAPTARRFLTDVLTRGS